MIAFATPADRADAAAFLARVVRLDPAALVRLRTTDGALALWAWLPLDVLVSRSVRADGPADAAVSAKALLDVMAGPPPSAPTAPSAPVAPAAPSAPAVPAVHPNRTVRTPGQSPESGVPENPDSSPGQPDVTLPARRDAEWRGALPASTAGALLDEVPAEVVARLLDVAEKTFREASATADPRAVGDALLDHDALTVTAGDRSAGVPLRMLLALARMGFLGTDPTQVALLGSWVRVSASFGAAYLRRGERLALFPATSG